LKGCGGSGRANSIDDSWGCSDLGDVEEERPNVRDCDGGVRVTGGSMPRLREGVLSPISRNDGEGPVLEGERERARSVRR
jgi:hypothetical protein